MKVYPIMKEFDDDDDEEDDDDDKIIYPICVKCMNLVTVKDNIISVSNEVMLKYQCNCINSNIKNYFI